ncbi:AbrB/MazE/SpoVT family DNA-binding domain-containing protein [Candidatus Woesearchaeota archaeon]|nr:AbrB/MazE/SpoVT family DNA-binding domain-containing protein [Candidatus Woesearchaeota archaeon]
MLIKGTVGKHGVVLIPKSIREQLGLYKGVKVTIEDRVGEIFIKKLPL